MDYKKHKFNFFPEMSGDDLQALKNSIAKGFNESLGKIVLFDGEILDGWNRYLSCIELNIKPVFETFAGTEEEAFYYSINANQDRRHLTKSQLAAVAIDAEPIWDIIQENVQEEKRRKISESRQKEEAARKERERQEAIREAEAISRENERENREKELKERLKREQDEKEKQKIEAEEKRIEQEREKERLAEIERREQEEQEKQKRALMPPSAQEEQAEKDKNKATTKLGNVFGVGNKYISEAKRLKRDYPELYEAVKSGEKTITEALKEVKKLELKEKKKEYDKRIQGKTDSEFKIDIFNTEKTFRVIYADPAWSYNDKQNTPQLGGAAKHYDSMSISQLCELPVDNISENNSVLFLWVTSPLLEDAFRVVNSWGFKYKTSFIWDKVKHNMGHYNSVRHELLLVCTKGSCTPDTKKLFDSVQSIERNDNHSEKPIEFLNIINELYNFGDKIELFCRKIKKQNWHGWGNEI